MKKYFGILLMGIFAVCLFFTGCTKKLEMPSSLDIKNNGGSVVTVGEYVYFANGYKSYGSLSSGDNRNNETLSNITRVKTENSKIVYDKDGKVLNAETVNNKVAGYEYTNLYVVGDSLYFTTPNTLKNVDRENKFEYVSLFKMKLDGTSLKEVLTIEQDKPILHFTKISGQDYLFYTENSKLYSVALGKDTRSLIASDVTNVVFDTESEITTAYYTQNKPENQTGNILKTVNLLTKESKEVINLNNVTFELKFLSNGNLFYTRTDSLADTIFYYNNFSNSLVSEEILIAATEITDLKYAGKTVAGGIVVTYVYQENLYVKVLNDPSYTGTTVEKDNSVSSTAKNILGAFDDYVYYLTESGIYRVSYKNTEIEKISSKTDVKTNVFDYDGRNVYFFSKIDDEEKADDNYYMFTADTHYANLDDESKLIGVK